MGGMPIVRRRRKRIERDPTRVITRLHLPHRAVRILRIIKRVMRMPEQEAAALLARVYAEFSERHRTIDDVFRRHFKVVSRLMMPEDQVSDVKQQLIGAYFTMEYSIDSAALFNPSIVLHPDQCGLNAGAIRFIMSLRAVGEGHISSIEFRSGIIDENNAITFDAVSDFVERAELELDTTYNKHLFQLKLNEMQACNEITTNLLDRLPEDFNYNQLREQIMLLEKENAFTEKQRDESLDVVQWLARSNYELKFDPASPLSERVIFPASENERSGIEDARFVRFVDDDGQVTYYATYTAYNGLVILPQLIETRDFLTIKMITLNGRAIQNKGMALFPRRIKGKYVMLSRQDNENNHIMFSDHLHFWQKSTIIQRPSRPWEFIQIGNCGSPLETPEGWLVLTHGVGPMRQYSISAILLDLEEPGRVAAVLNEPLMKPKDEEREGYVPNVVYSCGALINRGELIIPYAMSDTTSGIATVSVKDLIANMKRV